MLDRDDTSQPIFGETSLRDQLMAAARADTGQFARGQKIVVKIPQNNKAPRYQ